MVNAIILDIEKSIKIKKKTQNLDALLTKLINSYTCSCDLDLYKVEGKYQKPKITNHDQLQDK